MIQSLFPDRQNDFVLSIGEGDVVLLRQMPEGSGIKELNKIASSIEEALPCRRGAHGGGGHRHRGHPPAGLGQEL